MLIKSNNFNEIVEISQNELDIYKSRGYSPDLLPVKSTDRAWKFRQYFAQWMGVIHNIPNYSAILGFLMLGISPIHVFIGSILSGLIAGLCLGINGAVGTKYGIPFSLHMRSTYGMLGAKLPGFLRGVVSAIAWFGVQTYIGALVLTILISRLWPGFLEIGGGSVFLGITIPDLISFSIFWIFNMIIGLSGGHTLNKFTSILTPIIVVVFGTMTVWGINVAGGISSVFSAKLAPPSSANTIFLYLMIISSSIGMWAPPISNSSDFSRNACSQSDQIKGQTLGLFLGYILFAFMAISVSVGGGTKYGILNPEAGILEFVKQWDNSLAVVIVCIVFLSITISTNAATNIIPAGYQLTALFPKRINEKSGVLLAGILGFIVQPWKLMSGDGAILAFLNLIGALLGPIAGVLICDYYIIKKQNVDMDELYSDLNKQVKTKYSGINIRAYVATIIGLLISISGKFIPSFRFFSETAWIVGFITSFILYFLFNQAKKEQ
ncbi:MAG: cytosine permease [Johnsonella sp.]|nr:cytosine permease [Johnsonella sp.]